ncbi:MAG: hypothetical protein JWO91_2449 [Acidobacteriaceae bacterium]|jgi:hypothetical protein|nr:hypothetical protein [Acidobacteriaceae bacterium]
MYDDNFSTTLEPGTLSPQTLYRGLYVRIARKLEVDPSYVSRVARGERRSKSVESALRIEIEQINKKVVGGRSNRSGKAASAQIPGKRLRFFVTRNRDWVRKEWLQQSQADHNLKNIKLSNQRRLAPLTPLIDEALRAMKFSLKEMSQTTMKAANQHGRARREQGYSITALLEEYNLVRRCVFALAEDNFRQLDTHFLLHDLGQIGEVLDLQMQSALRAFTGEA